MSYMQQQSNIVHSQNQTGLTKLSGTNTDLILREQPDKTQAISHIAHLIDRVAMLWLIPNWTIENSVALAEWTFETYQYDKFEIVCRCLKTPPITPEVKTWRLTPEIISGWMVVFLEKEVIEREKENQKLKESFKEELPEVDYEAFKKRVTNGILNDVKPSSGFDNPKYKEYRQQYLLERQKENKNITDTSGTRT